MSELLFGEDFFIQEIKEGVRLNGEVLTEDEAKILKTDIFTVTKSGKFESESMRNLNDKCVRALSKSYSFAIADNNIQRVSNARYWRDNNGYVYKHSKNVISGIVQNWYLSVGRKQEKSIGCLSVIIVAIGIISLAIFLICFLIIV
jgi:hypothetical protein